MRIAAVYDIHGNLPALEAVLDAIAREAVDRIVVGGDVVPGPMPRECMATLSAVGVSVRFIRGNGESAVLDAQRGGELARVPQRFHEVIRWVARQLDAEQLAQLAEWPLVDRAEVHGLGKVAFCHATPRDDNEIFTRITPEDRLRPIFDAVGADVILCGHTHMQFDRTVGDVRVLNAGSVGMPFGEPGAYWAMVGPDGVDLRRTDYDLSDAARRVEDTGYPMQFSVEHPASEATMLETFEAAALA